MAIVAVLGRKGGIGKSTIAGNLAAEFAAMGQSVIVLDADPQHSLADWAAQGEGLLSRCVEKVKHEGPEALQAKARKALKMLSDETGGIAFFPKNIEQIDEIAAEVAQDIRSQYTLGYHSTKPTTEAGFRGVQVVAKGKGHGKLTVRTRTGYFPVAHMAKKPTAAR